MANAARFIWIDDGLRNASEGQVPFLSAALQYGFSVFEGIRCYATATRPGSVPAREHVERLLDSAQVVGFRNLPFSLEQILTAIQEDMAANEFSACYIRPMIYLDGAHEHGESMRASHD